MSYARPIHPGKTYLVTRRIERRHCLLRPDSELNALVLYTFIVAANKHGILLHAICAMSTHLHYVVTDPLGKLPRFLEMLHRHLALGVKIIRKWEGAVWDRSQTSVVDLCTRQAIVEKIAYILANPVAGGLVWSAEEWPGIKTSPSDIGEKKLEGQRPLRCINPKNPEWPLHPTLEVSLPPSIPISEVKTFQADIAAELKRLEAATHEFIPRHRVLGVERVLKIAPESRITTREPRRQRNPTFAVGRENAEALARAKRELRQFRTSYREALVRWRAGERIFHNANVTMSDKESPIAQTATRYRRTHESSRSKLSQCSVPIIDHGHGFKRGMGADGPL
jgi:putative transposase